MSLLLESPLFCRLARNREKFTQRTEILVHGGTFSITNCAEFTVFTCLTLFDFPVQVVSNLPFLSFIFLISKRLTKKMYINQRKTFLLHSAAPCYLLTVGTKDCDWPAWLSKVNNNSQHSSFVWDPPSCYTKAQKSHL